MKRRKFINHTLFAIFLFMLIGILCRPKRIETAPLNIYEKEPDDPNDTIDISIKPPEQIKGNDVLFHLSNLIFRWRWQEALSYMDSLGGDIADFHDWRDVYFIRGYCHLKLGQYATAESVFAILIATDYDLNDWTSIFLAQAALNNGDYDLAYQVSKSVKKLPAFVDTIAFIRWNSLMQMKNYEKALNELDMLRNEGFIGEAKYSIRRINCLRKMGREDEARKIARDVIEKQAGTSQTGRIMSSAARELEKMPPLTDDDKRLIAISYYYNKNYSDALEWFEKYPGTEKIGQLRYYRAVCRERSNHEVALDEYLSILRDNAFDRPSLFWRIARCHRKLKNYKSSQQFLDSALSQCKSCGNLLSILQERIFLAQDMNNLRDFAVYSKKLAAANVDMDSRSVGLIWAAVAYIALGLPDSTVAITRRYRNTFSSADFIDEIRYWEAKAFLAKGDTATADSIFKCVSQSTENNLFVWLALEQIGRVKLPDPRGFRACHDYQADSIVSREKKKAQVYNSH